MPLVDFEDVRDRFFPNQAPPRRPEPCFVRTRPVDRRIAFAAFCFKLPSPVPFVPIQAFSRFTQGGTGTIEIL